MSRTYLDHNATTHLRPFVKQRLMELLTNDGINANGSAVHASGRAVRATIDTSREVVAGFFGVDPHRIIFTSGATESNMTAWRAFSRSGKQLATTPIEHACNMAAASRAERDGADVTYLGVDADGQLTDLDKSLSKPFDFVSIQAANNETGILSPMEEIVSKSESQGFFLHSDIVQVPGKLVCCDVVSKLDAFSVSAHKLGGLPGVGCLYIKKRAPIVPLIQGGGQERGMRSGTENVLGIVSLAAACQDLAENGDAEARRMGLLRDQFEERVCTLYPQVQVTGKNVSRLPNTSHLRFEGLSGEALLQALDLEGVDASMGSACSSGAISASHVLLAMGIPEASAKSALRFSFGWNSSEKDVDHAVAALKRTVEQVQASAA